MICHGCRRGSTKQDMAKAVGEYLHEGVLTAYGADRPAGKPEWLGGTPQGTLQHFWHYKCFMANMRKQARDLAGVRRVTADVYQVDSESADMKLLQDQQASFDDTKPLKNDNLSFESVIDSAPSDGSDDQRAQVVLDLTDL